MPAINLYILLKYNYPGRPAGPADTNNKYYALLSASRIKITGSITFYES